MSKVNLAQQQENRTFHTTSSTDFITISYSPRLRYLETCWQRPVSIKEYRAGVRAIASATAILQARYSLLDFSKMGVPTVEAQQCTTSFLKGILQKISLHRGARVMAANVTQQHAYDAIVARVKKLPYKTEVFFSQGKARKWLFEEEESRSTRPDDMVPIPLNSSYKTLRKLLSNIPDEENNHTHSLPDWSEPAKITTCRTDFVEIVRDKQTSLITVRWLKQPRSREYRYGVLKAGRAVLEHGLEKILFNNQRLGVLTIDDQNWTVAAKIKILSRSKIKQLAVVSSHNVLQQMATESISSKVKKANLPYRSMYFLSELEALDWLLQDS